MKQFIMQIIMYFFFLLFFKNILINISKNPEITRTNYVYTLRMVEF